MSAREDLVEALNEHRCCFSDQVVQKLVNAHRDEVALEIGRDTLRDGLVPTLIRLVGEANATKLMVDVRNAHARELAEQQRATKREPTPDDSNMVRAYTNGWNAGRQDAADDIDPQTGE